MTKSEYRRIESAKALHAEQAAAAPVFALKRLPRKIRSILVELAEKKKMPGSEHESRKAKRA